MDLTPQNIQKDFEDKKINKITASNLLISIIENIESKRIRIEAIKTLDNLDLKNNAIFNLLENLVISDSDKEIRLFAAKYLKTKFIDKAIKPFKWVIENESDYECIITVIQSLIEMDLPESKAVLINEIKKISNNKYLNRESRIRNQFKKILKKEIRQKKIIYYTKQELGLILINYLTILNLTMQYPNIFYELNPQTGLIETLDLSDYMEYEVKGAPFGWKNNIRSLREIVGLFSLNTLKEIDLSNNLITDVKEIPQLKELTHLKLRNNKINEIENLSYIKRLPKLKYLDLRGNKIVKKLSLKDFDSKIKVLLKDISLK
jgi:hypothetical protein